MITFKTGDIFETTAEAIVNPVNTVGVMGKGLALEFKNRFPYNYEVYVDACKNGLIDIGNSLVVTEMGCIIINFPTKKHWRDPSEYSYIKEGLIDLVEIIQSYELGSISIPALGVGNGKLNWEIVKEMITEELSGLDGVDIIVYEPI